MTSVDLSNIESLDQTIDICSAQHVEKQLKKGQTLVISGGDGFENYNLINSNQSNEGKGDSTNHLLLWVF